MSPFVFNWEKDSLQHRVLQRPGIACASRDMDNETESTPRTPMSPSASESSNPAITLPLPEDLERDLSTLVSYRNSVPFYDVETAYSSAVWECTASQRFALSRATVERYLELTASLYEEHAVPHDDLPLSFCAFWESGPRESLLADMTNCGAKHFARLLRYCLQRREDVQYALGAALREGRIVYVKWFCTVVSNFPDLAQIFVDVVWSPRHDHLHAFPLYPACCKRLTCGMARCYLEKTLRETASWMEPDPDYDMASLATYVLGNFRCLTDMDLELRLTPPEIKLLPKFAEFCVQGRASVVAIFMAVLVKDWPLVSTVLGKRPEELQDPSFPISKLVYFMRKKANVSTLLESILAVVDRNVVNTLRFDLTELRKSELTAMSSMCRIQGHPTMALFFLLHVGNWKDVMAGLFTSQDHDTIDMVVLNAARYGQWHVAKVLFPFTSGDATVMSYVFQRAAADGEAALAERLLPRVDLALLPFVRGDPMGTTATFFHLLDFAPWTDTITKMKIVLMFVREGLASHCRNGKRVVMAALEQRMPAVALLLLNAGMVSKEQFSQVLLEMYQRRYRLEDLSFRQSVDHATQMARLDSPRTLQDSCRLALSHSVGFGPGRQQRIEQLPLPPSLRRLVTLSDLCDPVEARLMSLSII